MNKQSFITLTDRNGNDFVCDEQSLLDQLAALNMPGTKGLRTATATFMALVKQMREAQKAYFSFPEGAPSKDFWLNEAKKLEKKTDGAIVHFNKIIDLL